MCHSQRGDGAVRVCRGCCVTSIQLYSFWVYPCSDGPVDSSDTTPNSNGRMGNGPPTANGHHAISAAGMHALFGTRNNARDAGGAGAAVTASRMFPLGGQSGTWRHPYVAQHESNSGYGGDSEESREDSDDGGVAVDSDDEVLESDSMLEELSHPRTGIPTTDLKFGEAYYPRAFTGYEYAP